MDELKQQPRRMFAWLLVALVSDLVFTACATLFYS